MLREGRSMRLQNWLGSFTLFSSVEHYLESTGRGVLLLGRFASSVLFFFFFALHTTGWLHVTQITVKSPHAQSFQLLNNTKQTVTYFRSREQAREKTWSGVRHGSGPREEQPGIRRRRGALTDRRRYWFVLVFRDRRRVRPEQKAWYAMWAPESDPAVLGVPDRGL